MTSILASLCVFDVIWRSFDVMTFFDVMTSFDVITSFWRHDELFDVMTCLWRLKNVFDVMMYFWRHDAFLYCFMLHKLNIYGIRGAANKWIESYLTNRSQYVDFDSHASSSLPVRCGVPQGSMLGPLLFLLYINDISHGTTENILSFADDTTVFISDSDPRRLFSRANKSLEAVFHWFCANRLSLNKKKSIYGYTIGL